MEALVAPGTAGDETNAGAAGELAIGLRHVGGAAFLAAGDQVDVLGDVVKGIQRRQIAFSRNAENRIDTMNAQGVDKNLPTCSLVVAGRHWFLLISPTSVRRHRTAFRAFAGHDHEVFIAIIRPLQARLLMIVKAGMFVADEKEWPEPGNSRIPAKDSSRRIAIGTSMRGQVTLSVLLIWMLSGVTKSSDVSSPLTAMSRTGLLVSPDP